MTPGTGGGLTSCWSLLRRAGLGSPARRTWPRPPAGRSRLWTSPGMVALRGGQPHVPKKRCPTERYQQLTGRGVCSRLCPVRGFLTGNKISPAEGACVFPEEAGQALRAPFPGPPPSPENLPWPSVASTRDPPPQASLSRAQASCSGLVGSGCSFAQGGR